MPDLSLDLRYLRYVLAVVEQGSFRRAGLKLDLPQSTISRRVQILERRIGVAIFDRDHTGVTLTAAGSRFVEEAMVGAKHFTNAVGAINSLKRGNGGSLRLAMFASLSKGFLRTLIARYHRRYPEVECHFEEGSAQTSLGGVLEGRLDVAFVTGQPTAPGCQCLPLWNERLFVAVPLDHGLSSTDEVEWSQLRNERFIVTTSGRGPEIEGLLLSRLAGPGFRPDIQVHAVSRETILHMVELHFGLGVVTETAVVPDTERVRFLPLADGDHTVQSSAIWLKSNTNPTLPPLMEIARQLQSEDGE